MAIMVTISPRALVFLLCFQNILAQQLLNNNVGFYPTGISQQPKTTCGTNQAAVNPGIYYNTPQQANLQQMSYQQPSNIQQAQLIQQIDNTQPQFNQVSSQQVGNAITNSQLIQQQNQAPSIFSALHNIKQSSQQQGLQNFAKNLPLQQTVCCGLKQNADAVSQFQNQPSSTFSFSNPGLTQPQSGNQPSPTVYLETQQLQPMFTFQALPSNNGPTQQSQQMIAAIPNAYDGENLQNQPKFTNQQPMTMQNPITMIPGAQTNIPQSQPIVLTFQAPQMSSAQGQPTLSSNQNQPIIYTVQTQPSSVPNQNRQTVSNQQGGSNNVMDQSLMSYVMSQINQNAQGNNLLASILPAILNTKTEKSSSSSMKALLPLIFNMLNERKNGCECPHCGCNKCNNQNTLEPVINSGYANQKDYSKPESIDEVLSQILDSSDKSLNPKYDDTKPIIDKNNEIPDISVEASEEDEEEESGEEEEDE